MPSDIDATSLFARFDSFCKSVVKNTARDLGRKARRTANREILVPNPEAQHDQIGLQHIPNGHFVKLVYSRGKAYEVIREDLYLAMSRLPQNELETIILLYWEGLWQTEVAAFLGISPRTVYARKERAIEKLRQWMRMPEENDDTTENDTG